MDWWLLTLLSLAAAASGQEETCLSGEEDPYLMFGTKTAYTFAVKPLTNSRVHDVAGCTPVAFWSLNRHGSHNPEPDEILELQKLEDLRSNVINNNNNGNFRNTNHRMCSADINLLERWQWNPRQNVTFAGDLTSDGYLTMQQLAQAWRAKFPALITNNRHDYVFKFASDKRLTTTFRSFTEGLFGVQAEGYDIPKQNDEKILRPYKFCPAWTREVEENNETISQLRIFESKQEYKEMISNISLRLGFNYDVDRSTVLRMYQMCRYNKAWDVVQLSPWCAAFTKEDLKRLEYAEDLETYYKYGYGSALNQQLGCTHVKDMMDFFTRNIEHADPPQQPRNVIHFTDAPMLLLTLSALNSHKDSTPLTGDNYRNPKVFARKWTTSTMAPFNGNLAAVLYRCNTNSNYQIQEQYQVLFLENEQQMYLEGCRVGLCDWSLVKQRYGDLANSCDLKFCNGAKTITGFVGLCVAIVTFVLRIGL